MGSSSGTALGVAQIQQGEQLRYSIGSSSDTAGRTAEEQHGKQVM
jgi:hypothetical protein